ncbi:hypothetical protein GPALN_014563 [Globodera pallida]|nr:hypothetical protein GPALN_014563 [Globodera pallida]
MQPNMPKMPKYVPKQGTFVLSGQFDREQTPELRMDLLVLNIYDVLLGQKLPMFYQLASRGHRRGPRCPA